MARYLGPKEKIERRLGEKLFLKGERSHSPKSAITKRPYPPGMHGKRYSRRVSEYGQQLKAKQKVRNMYRMLERQFKKTVLGALNSKKNPYESISEVLESRLDNIVFRAGFAQSRDQARQIVNHGHVLVNKKRVSIPSFNTKMGQRIDIRDKSKQMPYFSAIARQYLKNYETPSWISTDKEGLSSTIKSSPGLKESGLRTEDLQAIIEFYSR